MEPTNIISNALSNVGIIFDSAVDMITTNPLALAYVGLGLAGAGIGLFRHLVPRSR